MRYSIGAGLALLLPALLAAAPVAAESGYYVRPYIEYGDARIDGVQQNGPTSATQQVHGGGHDLIATADLARGQVKSLLNITGPDAGAQVVGTFGDTVTFSSDAIGRLASVSFAFDGTLSASGSFVSDDSNPILGYYATLYVYRAGSAVSYSDYGIADYADYQVVGQARFMPFEPSSSFSTSIVDAVSGSFTIDAGRTYQIFAGLSLFAAHNGDPITTRADFLNTGQLGIETPDGATFTSASGVLLTAAASPAPEPASWALMIVGFGVAGNTLRRRTRRRALPAFA